MKEVTLTTKDNPYDPFDQFDQWFIYDVSKGYNSCGYLARVARTSDALSDEEYSDEIERAVDEIIKHDFLDIYRKAERVSAA